jgi:predicted dehydrogenase
MLRIGTIGIGRWGLNYARIFNGLIPGVTLTACVDRVDGRLQGVRAQYPHVEILSDHRELLKRRLVDAAT